MVTTEYKFMINQFIKKMNKLTPTKDDIFEISWYKEYDQPEMWSYTLRHKGISFENYKDGKDAVHYILDYFTIGLGRDWKPYYDIWHKILWHNAWASKRL